LAEELNLIAIARSNAGQTVFKIPRPPGINGTIISTKT
jgi:hypothetical protein